MQAIQIGNEIAGQQVVQLQKLRQLAMAQMQAQNAYMAAQEQKEMVNRAAEEQFFRYRDPKAGKTYKSYDQF
jgi:P-type conjugative transfer protein TrbJ